MTISRERFDEIKHRWGDYSSWAIWRAREDSDRPKAHVGDLTVLDPDLNPSLLDVLKPEVVIVGLNASSRGGAEGSLLEPFRNFHEVGGRSNDFKLRHAFQGTRLWGGFMTDLVEAHHETDSKKVLADLKANPARLEKHAETFHQKLATLGSLSPLLVALGGDTYRLLDKQFGSTHRILRITHFAHRVGKERYAEGVAAALAGLG